MCTRYNGATSSFQACPGGGPHGRLLTGLLFCLQVRKAPLSCVKAENESNQAQGAEYKSIIASRTEPDPTSKEVASGLEDDNTTAPRLETKTDSSSRLVFERESSLWLEGHQAPNFISATWKTRLTKKLLSTTYEKISLRSLIKDSPIIGPLPYHGRFNLIQLEKESILQHQLDNLVKYARENHIVLNSKKTKCMPFNNSKTWDFVPKLSIEKGSNLEFIYKLQLVGLVLTSDLSWKEHINYTRGRVNITIWQLMRFKRKGADMEKFVIFYTLKIRSVHMFGSVCFHSSLTNQQSWKLEL